MQKEKIYSCIAIDDEANAIADMEEYISSLPELNLIKTYNDPTKALKEILAGEKVDLIFMDVDMPMISGVELSQAIRHKANKLIFTTSHSKYALDAFEVEADGFLLKPISYLKFAKTIIRIFPSATQQLSPENKTFFFVKNKEDHLKLEKIRYDQIIAIESTLNYIRIHTTTQSIITYQSLSSIKEFLTGRPEFLQVQRSSIISTAYIECIDKNIITMFNDLKVTIGDHYREDVLRLVRSNTIKHGKK